MSSLVCLPRACSLADATPPSLSFCGLPEQSPANSAHLLFYSVAGLPSLGLRLTLLPTMNCGSSRTEWRTFFLSEAVLSQEIRLAIQQSQCIMEPWYSLLGRLVYDRTRAFPGTEGHARTTLSWGQWGCIVVPSSIILAVVQFMRSLSEKPLGDAPIRSYNSIVMIHSLADFAKKKRVWLLCSISSDFDPEQCHSVRIIAVVGLFNKGKTFLLNKLFNLDLPSGKMEVTQGLSFVHLKQCRMLLIDSPGVQATVSYSKSESGGANRVIDAQSTEGFQFELVSQLSDHVIFVVNDFTSVEQKYVQMFQQKEEVGSRPAREMIVVHNLASTKVKNEAEAVFRTQITSRYDGVPSHLGKLFYTAKCTPPVHHIAICQDGSSAGRAFNRSNLDLIMGHLEQMKKLPDDVKLQDIVREKMDSLLPRFMLMGAGEAGHRTLQYQPATEGRRAGLEESIEGFPYEAY